jgi:hypothetical protein
MASTATARTAKRKANLFGFGRTTSFSSKALKDAYDAGYKGQAGHRDFTAWLKKQKDSGEYHSSLTRQLREEYARGEKDYFARNEVGGKGTTFKGQRIVEVGGEYAVPGLDRESRFESVKEAKRFIMANPRKPTIYEALAAKLGRTPTNAELKADVERIKREAYEELARAGKLPHQRRRRRNARGPIESTVTGVTRTGTSVGRYLDSQLGKVLKNPQAHYLLFSQTMYRTIGEHGPETVSGPTTKVGHGTKIEIVTTKGKRVLVKGHWDNAPFYGWVDKTDAATAGGYKSTHGAEPEGMRSNPTRMTQGGAVAYVTELDSGVYAAEVVSPDGAREEKEFKGRGSEQAAQSWARLRMWEVAGRTTRSNPTGDGRPWLKMADGRTLAQAQSLATKLKTHDRKLRVMGGSGNYTDVEVRQTFERPSGKKEYGVFVIMNTAENPKRRGGKRNPESSAASLYSSFHGRDSQETVVIERDEHYHENVAGLGVCCGVIVDCPSAGIVTIGMSGYEWQGRVPKGKWHKSDGGFVEADPNAEDVLLSSNEDGTQLFFDGGDQALDISVLGLKGAAADKESIVIGDVSFIAYETEKEFDGFELVQYVHQFSEDSGGPLPQLRYERLNEAMYLDGGSYFIKQPVVGVSPGIED